MKKQAILRGLLGSPLGVAMGQFITVASSAASGYGTYSAVMPEFAAELGSELGAVALQMLLCGLMGAAFGAASVIWQLERWSIAAQSAAYFAVGAAAMLPAAYIAHWMERSAAGFAVYRAYTPASCSRMAGAVPEPQGVYCAPEPAAR